MDLLTQIQELRARPDFEDLQLTEEWLDLQSNRHAEILSEIPVPFCCSTIAGARVAAPSFHGNETTWRAPYRVPGNGYTTVPISACPFCATPLPKLVLKVNPPPVVCKSDNDYYCDTCTLRLNECMCSSPLSVYEAENAPPVFAVTALIPNYLQKKFLSVSRKNDPADKGLPGGKVDPGETLREALVREVLEETGLTIVDFHLIFDGIDSTGKRCLTYEVTRFTGEVSTQEAGAVEWVTQKGLTAPGLTFEVFNRALFHHVNPYGF